MKKLFVILLCLAMALSTLTACDGGNATPTDNSEQTENTGSTSLPPEDDEGDIVLTIGIPQNAGVEDYNTNAFTLWLEEQTGYDLQFVTFQGNSTDYGSQLSVMMTSGEVLPDILWRMSLSEELYTEYGEDEFFIDLKPYYEDKELSATFWERFERLDEEFQDYVLKRLTSENGAMYAFPRIENSEIDVMDFQAMINQEWLDKLNLAMPTDTDSLYEVLKAFKTGDPNGNGKADEIPLLFVNDGIYGDGTSWLINMFVYMDEDRWFNVDENNQLYLPHMTEQYRKALTFINKLVKEGLVPDTCWSMTSTDLKSLANPGDGVSKVGILLGHPTVVMSAGYDSIYSYAAMPYWGNVDVNMNAVSYNTFITENCEHPRAAWKLLMLMCSEEGSRRMRYGELGVDWDYADEGSMTMLGTPAEIKILNDTAFTGQNNQTWKAIGATILLDAENETAQLSENINAWTKYKLELLGAIHDSYFEARANNNPDEKYVCPYIYYSLSQSDVTSTERTNCKSYIHTARANFCTGTGEFNDPTNDAQWEKYLKGVESNGLAAWIKQAQQMYEEQYPERG